MVAERAYRPSSGWIPLVLMLGLVVGGPLLFAYAIRGIGAGGGGPMIALLVISILAFLGAGLSVFGFMAIAPNDSRVLLLFGEYKGSVRQSGFFWVNPFFTKRRLSLRIRNFETGSIHTPERKDAQGHVIQHKGHTSGRPSKVNDRDGNPIEISAVVVWRVVNTAEALFEVDDYEDFLAVQSESALRSLASRHPYDSEDHEVSLRGNTADVCEQLKHDIHERLDKAG